jgi:HAD superfamily hydrolase (TIGR01509 family)
MPIAAEMTLVTVTVRGRALGMFGAFVFDLDGVVTDTTGLHTRAWQTVFDGHLGDLAASAGVDAAGFDPVVDYAKYLDGRPRFDATHDVLKSRGICLPFGEPSDPAGAATVCALANAKNREFLRLVRSEGVQPYPSTVALLQALRTAKIPTALVSSSMDCDTVTHAAGVAGHFDVRLSGVEIRALGVPGKPHPGGFLEAARRLGVEPADAVVVEDAVAGVEAARRGGFGLIVGIDRKMSGKRLARFADVVIKDADEMEVSPASAGDTTRESFRA